ncbi:phage tail protein [Micromonospora sp. NPDC005806]|uniref:phage tail protein n=1 Tax=Micromonospora sp. NPDC005806 TaxID=3364234 RepID=UPI0036C5ED59
MDVQGSQYHLIHGRADWAGCVDVAAGRPLGDLWQQRSDTAWEYDDEVGWLRLRRDTPLFRRAGRTPPMDPAGRRGAGRDGYGNWYWIDTDRRGIQWLPVGDAAAAAWWSVDDLSAACAAADGFTAAAPCPAADAVLSGLAVTTHHYLVAGYTSADESGLLLFDLQGGGGPLRLVWPAGEPFTPIDLCDLPDGGVLVLEPARYWRLDEHFRVRGQERSRTAFFAATDGSGPLVYPEPAAPRPYDLGGVRPISIEPGPGGSVLVLDADPVRGWSTLYCFDEQTLRWQTPLRDIVEVIDPADPASTAHRYSVLGYDFVYLDEIPVLYVADSEGDQVVAFTLDPATGELIGKDDFLPMRRFAGRALVRATGGAWYDFGERWVPLAVFTECRFASAATLVTALASGTLPGEMFDGRQPGCVWHRLLLDAFVPTGTSIAVRARAADEADLVEVAPWVSQPVPYRRTDGSELPWAENDDVDAYELLFQEIVGRYLQLEITVLGTGRSSATIRSVRAWFPRFSYVDNYLPATYADNDRPARFLERFLANPEGILTAIEEKIEHSHLILDPRTARVADLPWLASWFGLVLDPMWTTERRRFLIAHVDAFYRRRGTVAGLLAMLRVFFDDTVDEASIFEVGAVPATASRIRLIERFLVEPLTADAAHRFDVQAPGTLTADQLAMVGRIVEQGKPAHAAFDLQPYEELFVVGRARLGLDTELVGSPRFVPVVLGETPLGRGYLGFQRPFDIADRVVADRDRLGSWPAL